MNDDRRGFSRGAASASLAMPLVAILLAGVWQANGVQANKAVLGLLCMACIAIGTVLAIVALCNAGQGGGVGRGVLALVFNGVFVALFGVAFISGFKQGIKARQTKRELMQAAETLRENRRKSFDPEFGLTNANTADVSRLREQMEKAASDFKGNDKLVAKAWAAYLREIEAASQKWQGMYDELGAAKVLEFSELNGKQELRDRQALVRRYKATSDAMRHLVLNSDDFFREQLTKAGATPGEREEAVSRLQAQLAKQAPILMQIRDLDTRISDDMLGILSLLETNWGSWSCPTGAVIFEDRRTLQTYNGLLADLRSAGDEQIAAQKKLVSVR